MTKVTTVVFIAFLIPLTVSGQSPVEAYKGLVNAAAFVSDVTIPDGTVMSPGQGFTKTWRIRNSGTTSWSGYNLAFSAGAQMGAPSSVSVQLTPPGASVDISVPMTAPTDGGNHKGSWHMRTADGKLFGQSVFVLIYVKSSTYEGRVFEDWEADLQAHSPAVRKKAIGVLSRFGPRATAALIKTFRSDPDEKVRVSALASLGDITPPTNDAISALMEAATNPSSIISTIAIMIIQEALPSKIGPETVPVLVDAMRDTNAVRRQLAIQLLARLGPDAIVAAPTLREIAGSDPEPHIRSLASEILKQIERRGMISENKYTSPRSWFSVPVPKSSNWANVPFSIQDTTVQQPKVGNYDLVAFWVKDFGEALIVSVRNIPDNMLDKMKQYDDRTVLSNLADKALNDWRDFPIKPNVVEEPYLNTLHGESLLRVYMAESASLLKRVYGGTPTESDTFDTLIAVIVAKQKSHYVYAIAENDAEDFGKGRNKEALKRRVHSFFESVVVHR